MKKYFEYADGGIYYALIVADNEAQATIFYAEQVAGDDIQSPRELTETEARAKYEEIAQEDDNAESFDEITAAERPALLLIDGELI